MAPTLKPHPVKKVIFLILFFTLSGSLVHPLFAGPLGPATAEKPFHSPAASPRFPSAYRGSSSSYAAPVDPEEFSAISSATADDHAEARIEFAPPKNVEEHPRVVRPKQTVSIKIQGQAPDEKKLAERKIQQTEKKLIRPLKKMELPKPSANTNGGHVLKEIKITKETKARIAFTGTPPQPDSNRGGGIGIRVSVDF